MSGLWPLVLWFILSSNGQYSRLLLSRPRLSRIIAYLEVKIWSLFKHENLTTGNKILWKRGEIAPLFHNIFNIFLTSGVKLYTHLWNVVVRFIFSSILQISYVEERMSRSILEGPLDFEITGVDCTLYLPDSNPSKISNRKRNDRLCFMKSAPALSNTLTQIFQEVTCRCKGNLYHRWFSTFNSMQPKKRIQFC